MADTKLSALTELATTPASDDEVYIRDVSEVAADESKRITVTNLMAAAGGGLDSGLIVMWHGTIGNIPAGFVICDGNNSTPNLLRKFVQGVDTAGTNPGATGGSATHVLSVAELAAHTHLTTNISGGGVNVATRSDDKQAPNASETSSTGSDSAHENEPEFYDLAFLMKT